jgi:tetratricopeptide (TPR) repeat protein
MTEEEGPLVWLRPWRWAIVLALALLFAYPFAQRTLTGGRGFSGTQFSAASKDLQLSFEHYQAGRYQEAVAAGKAAVSKDPNQADAYNNLAVSYLQLRMFDEATEAARQALRIRPDHPLAKDNLAWIEREKAKAEALHTQINTADSAGDLLNQSLQYAQTGLFKECMEAAKRATELDPGSAPAFNNLGFCAGKLQLWDEAIQSTEEAIRLGGDFQLGKNNLAWIRQQKDIADGTKAQ